jgi:hypothetical protein
VAWGSNILPPLFLSWCACVGGGGGGKNFRGGSSPFLAALQIAPNFSIAQEQKYFRITMYGLLFL